MASTQGIYTEIDRDTAAGEAVVGVGLDVFAWQEIASGTKLGVVLGGIAVLGSVGLYIDAARRFTRDHAFPRQDEQMGYSLVREDLEV